MTFGVKPLAEARLSLGHEHKESGRFGLTDLGGLRMPEGYRRSIRDWASRRGIGG